MRENVNGEKLFLVIWSFLVQEVAPIISVRSRMYGSYVPRSRLYDFCGCWPSKVRDNVSKMKDVATTAIHKIHKSQGMISLTKQLFFYSPLGFKPFNVSAHDSGQPMKPHQINMGNKGSLKTHTFNRHPKSILTLQIKFRQKMVLTQTKEAQISKICLKHQLTATPAIVKVALGNNQFSQASWEGGLNSVMSKKPYCPRIPSSFLGPFLQDIHLDSCPNS